MGWRKKTGFLSWRKSHFSFGGRFDGKKGLADTSGLFLLLLSGGRRGPGARVTGRWVFSRESVMPERRAEREVSPGFGHRISFTPQRLWGVGLLSTDGGPEPPGGVMDRKQGNDAI